MVGAFLSEAAGNGGNKASPFATAVLGQHQLKLESIGRFYIENSNFKNMFTTLYLVVGSHT